MLINVSDGFESGHQASSILEQVRREVLAHESLFTSGIYEVLEALPLRRHSRCRGHRSSAASDCYLHRKNLQHCRCRTIAGWCCRVGSAGSCALRHRMNSTCIHQWSEGLYSRRPYSSKGWEGKPSHWIQHIPDPERRTRFQQPTDLAQSSWRRGLDHRRRCCSSANGVCPSAMTGGFSNLRPGGEKTGDTDEMGERPRRSKFQGALGGNRSVTK